MSVRDRWRNAFAKPIASGATVASKREVTTAFGAKACGSSRLDPELKATWTARLRCGEYPLHQLPPGQLHNLRACHPDTQRTTWSPLGILVDILNPQGWTGPTAIHGDYRWLDALATMNPHSARAINFATQDQLSVQRLGELGADARDIADWIDDNL